MDLLRELHAHPGRFDGNGGGDGDIDNVATGDSDQTPPDTDTETVPLVRTPALNVTKDVTSVTGGSANVAGDVIVYSISIQNTGNVALTGITVTDKVEAYAATNATYVSGDAAPLGTLNVGETWSYTASYTLTQADLDGNGGGDGDIDNVATGDSDQTPPDTDTETVPLVRAPALNVTKDVTSVTGGSANVAGDVISLHRSRSPTPATWHAHGHRGRDRA